MSLHRITHGVSCKQASLLLCEAEDRRLSWLERWKLRLHLAVCDACTHFSRQLAFMRKAMERYRGQ